MPGRDRFSAGRGDDVALLNPAQEFQLAGKMLQAVEAQLRTTEQLLTQSVLDREAYLQKISRAITLREVHKELTALYRTASQT
jgi:hypothetical protein